MPLDSNGIWEYEETEDAAPVSEMLNRLGGSVSEQVGPHVIDTGWLDLPLSQNTTTTTGYPAQVRRIGHEVRVRGRLNRASSSSGQLWATVPGPSGGISLRPDRIEEIFAYTEAGRVFVDDVGAIRHQLGSATVVWLNSTWWVD